MRALLVLGGLLALVGAYLLMLRGWRSRQRRQAFLPAPPVPSGAGTTVVGAVPGLFVGTTFAGRWLDRVAVHGLSDRSLAELTVATDGVHVDREGASPVFVPFEAVERAEPGDALAGKVMGPGGLLLLTWRLGDSTVTSGFRATDHGEHARLADLINARRPLALEAS